LGGRARRGVKGGAKTRGAARPAGKPASARRSVGGEQVEGRQAVRELLAARTRPARDVWLAEGLDPAPVLRDINELAKRARVPVRYVSRRALEAEARTDGPQGVLAHAQPLPEWEFDDLCRAQGGPPPFLLAFDGVTDPQNMGALLRSAEGAGVTGAVMPRHRTAHVTPAVTKAAAGAVERVRLSVVPGLAAAVARARDLGVWVVGLDEKGDQSLFDLEVATEPVMLVVGDEGTGVSRLVRQRCDVVARIPLQGAIPSLNVAAAGTLAVFEVSRRR
jgi:23S rRNA (guanosine2251-2'-O)-methyltransferase